MTEQKEPIEEEWKPIKITENVLIWATQNFDEVLLVTQPEGHVYWQIYDTSGTIVEGDALGPFRSSQQAIDRIEDVYPGIRAQLEQTPDTEQ